MTTEIRSLGAPTALALAAVALAPLNAHAQALTLSPERTLERESAVASLDFSSDGALLLVGSEEGDLALFDPGSGEALRELRTDAGPLRFAGFTTGDTALVSVHEDGSILHFGVEGDEPPARLNTGDRPTRVALDTGRRYLAVATTASTIEIFDLPTRQRIGVIDARGDLDDLLHLGFDRLGRQLQAVTQRGSVTAWNPSTLQVLRRVTLRGEELYGSRSLVHSVGADRSANVIVVALEEVALPRGGLRGPARPGDLERRDQLIVYDWHSGAGIKGVPVPDGVIEHLAVGPGNDHAVVSYRDRVSVMDLRAAERGAQLTAPGPVTRLAVSPDDGRLAVGTADGQVGLWEMAYRQPVAADELDEVVPGLSGRLRILGDDTPAIRPEAMEVPVVVAVFPFDDRQGDENMPAMVAELLVTQLANSEHVRLVERLRIDAILEEQELQRQGLTEANGIRLGQILNADLIVLGSIGAFGTSHTLSARILDTETGEAISGRQVLCEDCRAQDFFDLVHLLGTAIAR